MWSLRSLEHASVIQKLTILGHKNGLVLSNTRVPVSRTWSILFPILLSTSLGGPHTLYMHDARSYVNMVFGEKCCSLMHGMICRVSLNRQKQFTTIPFDPFTAAEQYTTIWMNLDQRNRPTIFWFSLKFNLNIAWKLSFGQWFITIHTSHSLNQSLNS